MVNQQGNKATYARKMNRQIREWESRIADIESRASARKADKNPAVRGELKELEKKVRDTRRQLSDLERGSASWPGSARGVSGTYRNMKATAEDAGRRIKKK